MQVFKTPGSGRAFEARIFQKLAAESSPPPRSPSRTGPAVPAPGSANLGSSGSPVQP